MVIWPQFLETGILLLLFKNIIWRPSPAFFMLSGKMAYLYRCIDREGNLVDVMLSKNRDMTSAQQFFQQALKVAGQPPLKVTTDEHDAYPRAVREVLGKDVVHRNNQYLNNRIEQDHRAIKQRYYPMRGFGGFESAKSFCIAFEEIRQHFRYRTKANEKVSLADQRDHLLKQWDALQSLFIAA